MEPPLVSARSFPRARPTLMPPPDVSRSRSLAPPSTVMEPPLVLARRAAEVSPWTVMEPPEVSRSRRTFAGTVSSARKWTALFHWCSQASFSRDRSINFTSSPCWVAEISKWESNSSASASELARISCLRVSVTAPAGPMVAVIGPPEMSIRTSEPGATL